MAKLTAAKRRALPASEFAGPGRSYPIDTKARARNAKARVSEFGDAELKARVAREVRAKYPGIGKASR